VGLTRFELVTPRLSSVCSNQLSYRPVKAQIQRADSRREPVLSKLDRTCVHEPADYQIDHFKKALGFGLTATAYAPISRKEVIQPQVLLQLPCYDFTPITNHTLGAYLPCGLARRLLVQPAFVM
jgi:hypothetical protein